MFRERREFGDRRVTPDRRSEDAGGADERRGDDDRRQAGERRRRTLLSAKIIFNDRQSVQNCTVRNLSEHGARLIFGVTPMCPNRFELDMGEGEVHRCEVAYRVGPVMGVHFLDDDEKPLSQAPDRHRP